MDFPVACQNKHHWYEWIIFSQAVAGDCGFLAANLYARSIFGEDALANLSIEKPIDKPDSPVIGHVRIRAKSQVSCYVLD